MILRIFAKKDILNLRKKIESFLMSEESETWIFEKNIKTKANTVRPLFTHDSKQYKEKAGIVFLYSEGLKLNEPYIYVSFNYINDISVKSEYLGMITSMLLRKFENEINFITIS